DRDANRAPFAVGTRCGLGLHLMVGTGDGPQQLNLLIVEQVLSDEVAVGVKAGDLIAGESEECHGAKGLRWERYGLWHPFCSPRSARKRRASNWRTEITSTVSTKSLYAASSSGRSGPSFAFCRRASISA